MIDLARSGRSAGELSHTFGPSSQTIRNWIAQADRDEGRREDGLMTAEREELNRLRREVKQLKLEREILSKAAGLVCSGDEGGAAEGYRFMSENRAVYPISTMCRVLGVSSSGFYAWTRRSPSRRSNDDAVLIGRIPIG